MRPILFCSGSVNHSAPSEPAAIDMGYAPEAFDAGKGNTVPLIDCPTAVEQRTNRIPLKNGKPEAVRPKYMESSISSCEIYHKAFSYALGTRCRFRLTGVRTAFPGSGGAHQRTLESARLPGVSGSHLPTEHDEFQHFRGWAGEKFHAEEFDLARVNKLLGELQGTDKHR